MSSSLKSARERPPGSSSIDPSAFIRSGATAGSAFSHSMCRKSLSGIPGRSHDSAGGKVLASDGSCETAKGRCAVKLSDSARRSHAPNTPS